jgi:methyl-accepting chemotaxis protein
MTTVRTLLFALAAGGCVAAGAVAINSTVRMSQLTELQKKNQERSRASSLASEAAPMGSELYHVIADALINGNLVEADERWQAMVGKANNQMTRLGKAVDTERVRKDLKEAEASLREIIRLYEGEMRGELKGDATRLEKVRDVDAKIDAEVEKIAVALESVAADLAMEAKEAEDRFDQTAKRAFYGNIVIGLIAVLGLGGLGLWIVRNIRGQLGEEPAVLTGIAQRIARGDLSEDLRHYRPAARSLLESITLMQEGLRTIVYEISSTSEKLTSAALQLKEAAEQVQAATENQNDASSSMSSAIEEMTVAVGSLGDGAREAAQKAHAAGESSQVGKATVGATMDEMKIIAGEVDKATEEIKALVSESERITMVVNVIREVADQTNLLALNAAIEAARAGEHGRGFAVVADEVRKLAERTATSTREIASLIQSIQSRVVSVADGMQHGKEKLDGGITLASQAGQTINEASAAASSVVQLIRDIANALAEQNSANALVAQNVERIAQMSEENSQTVREVATAANSMSMLADNLNNVVKGFELGRHSS